MTPAEALINGRDFLVEHGWARGSYRSKSKNSYCAVGALFCGNFGEKYWEGLHNANFNDDNLFAVQTAQNYLTDVAANSKWHSVTSFNDYGAKRKRDVISLFNKAIKLASKG